MTTVHSFHVRGREVQVFHYLRSHHPGDQKTGRATGWYWWSEGHGGGPFETQREALQAPQRESAWTVTQASVVAHARYRLHTGTHIGVLADDGAQMV